MVKLRISYLFTKGLKMINDEQKKAYYQALLNKDKEYEGIFFVGVKTTGIFCRPTCTARKPKFESCDFFNTAQEALQASFRPCKRCDPLMYPESNKIIQTLIDAVQKDPSKRWAEKDLKKFAIDASTVRRQFKKRFGMTFVSYARAIRVGLAMKQIKTGGSVMEAQVLTGYESSSGFRDAFSKVMGTLPKASAQNQFLRADWLDTPLGTIIAIADDQFLYLLDFVNRKGLEREIERLSTTTKMQIVPGQSKAITLIKGELEQYFSGNLKEFKTPLYLPGTPFQQLVWSELKKIPFRQTCSYSELAAKIQKPTARRAVARANGANQFVIVIPCHRVVNSNGKLGGYSAGIARKEWLLKHEKTMNQEIIKKDS